MCCVNACWGMDGEISHQVVVCSAKNVKIYVLSLHFPFKIIALSQKCLLPLFIKLQLKFNHMFAYFFSLYSVVFCYG